MSYSKHWVAAVAIVALMVMLGWAVWYTKSLLPLLGLCILPFLSPETKVNTRCPKCGHGFIAEEGKSTEQVEVER